MTGNGEHCYVPHVVRIAVGAWLAALVVLVFPAIAAAHGVQGRADTPIPLSAFIWSAGLVVGISFIGLALGWKRPVLANVSHRAIPRSIEQIVLSPALLWALRSFTLGSFLLVLVAALFGSTLLSRNIAPLVVFVVWWVGLVPLTLVAGNVWRAINPWVTIAALLRLPDQRTNRAYPTRVGIWPAAMLLLVFGWLELVYTTPAEPRLIGALILGYTLYTVACMYRYGVSTWLDHGEVFSVYTSLIAHVSPWTMYHEAGARRIGIRWPVVGVTRIPPVHGLTVFICVLIATVTFDGLSGSQFWKTRDVAAAERLISLGMNDFAAGILVATLGLVGTQLVILILYLLAARSAAWCAGWPNQTSVGPMSAAFAHTLIPIAVAYFVAHYFTLFVFQAQDLIRLISDPFGEGWNLFGTADYRINFQLVSANTIWTVQVSSIVIGHVVALAVAHDRALELAANHREAVRSQWPMLILMILLTMAGLWSLSEGMASV